MLRYCGFRTVSEGNAKRVRIAWCCSDRFGWILNTFENRVCISDRFRRKPLRGVVWVRDAQEGSGGVQNRAFVKRFRSQTISDGTKNAKRTSACIPDRFGRKLKPNWNCAVLSGPFRTVTQKKNKRRNNAALLGPFRTNTHNGRTSAWFPNRVGRKLKRNLNCAVWSTPFRTETQRE